MARGANDRPVPTTRPPDAGSPWRSAMTVLALAIAYVGFVLGAQAPDLRVGQGHAALQAAQGAQHLATRDAARASAPAEKPDPGGPLPKPDPTLLPLATPDLRPDPASAVRAPLDRSTAPAGHPRPAHQPRAPPSVSA